VLTALLVFSVTFLAFLPALRAELVGWDDDVLLTKNAEFQGPLASSLRWMFSTTLLGNYMPLTWLSYRVDFAVGGLNPRAYHRTNNLLHAADAVLLFGLAWMLIRAARPESRPAELCVGAVFAALLFGVHPLRVESVAWVAERKDVLAALFLLPSVMAYLRYAAAPSGRRGWLGASVLLHALSMLCKVWGLTLPLVLLVLDVYPLRRWTGRTRSIVLEKWPFVAVSLAGGAVALHAQSTQIATVSQAGVLDRLAQSFYGLLYYPARTLLPIGLNPVHEYPATIDPLSPRFVGAAVGTIAITVALWLLRRRFPAGLAAWAIYIAIIAPVLGWVQVGAHFVADRYSYLSCAPWAILAGGALSRVCAGRSKWARAAAAAGATALVVVLFVLTWRQTYVWQNTRTLWESVVRANPASWTGNWGMGQYCLEQGDETGATRHFERAYAARPDVPAATINLAGAYARLGRSDEAAELFRRVESLPAARTSDLLLAAHGLGWLSRFDEARELYRRILARNDSEAEAHFRLAIILRHEGDAAGARRHFERTVELLQDEVRARSPNAPPHPHVTMYADSCRSLASLLHEQGEHAAAERYERLLPPIPGR
jgi:tetratricopeptide (TPR) repeat protein